MSVHVGIDTGEMETKLLEFQEDAAHNVNVTGSLLISTHIINLPRLH